MTRNSAPAATAARLTARLAAVLADCHYAGRRLVELQMPPERLSHCSTRPAAR